MRTPNKMNLATRMVEGEFSRKQVVTNVLNYIKDMSFSRGECVQLCEDIFGRSNLDYNSMADLIMSYDTSKKAKLF